jgi:hypothetical protein
MKHLEKTAVSPERTKVSTPTAADRFSGLYDVIPDEYDEIPPYVDLMNEEDNVSGTPTTDYDHLKETSAAYSKPYDKLIEVDNQEKN